MKFFFKFLSASLLLLSLNVNAQVVEDRTPATLSNKTIACSTNTLNGLNGVCKLFDVMNPAFAGGAKCDGTTDDSAAFAATIAAAPSGSVIVIPDKKCKIVTGLTVSLSNVHFIGADSASSIIDFEPTANGTLFTISAGGSEIFSNTIERLSITSADTTFTKTAILLKDTSRAAILDVSIPAMTGGVGITNPCAGGTDAQAGSIALRICGREQTRVVQFYAEADRNIVLSVNPNNASLANDSLHFQDVYLIHVSGVPGPMLWVDTGANFQNLVLDGYEEWAGGTYGFYMNDTSAHGSTAMRFDNVRWEQGTNATMASVVITGTAGQFSCTCTNLAVGQIVTISGTYGGTGSITGYSNPTTYYVSATNGTSTFTLQTAAQAPIVTTAGTPTGLTYTLPRYMFFIAPTTATFQVQFNNVWETAGSASNMFYFRNLGSVQVNTCHSSSAGVMFNIDSTDADVNWDNCLADSGSATNAIGGYPLQIMGERILPTRIVPLKAHYTNYSGYTSVALGENTAKLVTGGNNTMLGSNVASGALTTGTNNVLIGTDSNIDTAAASTSNTIQIGAGAAAVWSATGTGTPSTSATTIAGSETVAGLLTGAGIVSGGTNFTLGSGTGACASSSTLVGGAAAGSFLCTGTAGASTQVVNLPTAANGWSCWVSDATSGVAGAQVSPTATNAATLKVTIAATSDKVVFGCMGY